MFSEILFEYYSLKFSTLGSCALVVSILGLIIHQSSSALNSLTLGIPFQFCFSSYRNALVNVVSLKKVITTIVYSLYLNILITQHCEICR